MSVKKVIKLSVLGATGNLGLQFLSIIKEFSEFKVVLITGHLNSTKLSELSADFPNAKAILTSKNNINYVSEFKNCDIVVNLVSGLAGTEPTIAALKLGKTIITANKESIIAHGKTINSIRKPGQLIPIDSEHNSIHEILKANPGREFSHITITCSGGPFLYKTKEEIEGLDIAQALTHPRWNMGAKITLESAMLLNKGFELVEAHYLFRLPFEKIKVKVHPPCLIHGIVHFSDGQDIAYLSEPDMREHMRNALKEVLGQPTNAPLFDLAELDQPLLEPDNETFPGIPTVLKAFQKDPDNFDKFLKREELWVQKILTEADHLDLNEVRRLAE